MVFRIDSQLDPTATDVAAIDQGLHSYNQRAADLAAIRRFACYARSPDKALVGGALARWWGTACELQQIWVDEALRRRGIGASLMQRVEAIAIEHGCRLLYLDTFSYQAPEFYYRLGYETACQIDGFPSGGSKFTVRKSLVS
ncbi:MAG TPA: GNAT family N-acetyltransferase [Burkholderiaceae bacterium]|nr:GNAT family N-acetyltransferase [Burkholderiaceae bacterium]